MSNYKINDIRIFCWKYGVIYLGWIMVKKEMEPILYYDNDPIITIEPDINMRFVCIGLTKKGTMNRLIKAVDRIKEMEE